MGIGRFNKLLKFLEDDGYNPFNHYKLHDSILLVDGKNISAFFIREKLDKSVSQYGGDYDTYAEEVHSFFSGLKQCYVKPIVLFDGSFKKEENDKKQEKRQRQYVGRLKDDNTLPLLYKRVFLDIVDELQIPHMCCDFETDNQLVSLANALECPVTTEDTDFYIYNLSHGVLPPKHIKYSEADAGYIPCRIYIQNSFLSQLGHLMSRDHMILLATLMGNDVSKESNNIFEKVVSYLQRKGVKIGYGGSGSDPWIKNPKEVLRIVKNYRSIEQGKTEISGGDPSVSQMIDESFASYEATLDRKKLFFAHCHEIDELEAIVPKRDGADSIETEWETYGGLAFPSSYVELFRRSTGSNVLKSLTSHLGRLQPQVEDMGKRDNSHACAKQIREFYYAICLNTDESSSPIRIASYSSGQFTEEMFDISECTSLTLSDIAESSEEDNQEAFLKALGLEGSGLVERLCPRLIFPVAVIAYWTEKVKPEDGYIQALLTCLMKLSVVGDKEPRPCQCEEKSSKFCIKLLRKEVPPNSPGAVEFRKLLSTRKSVTNGGKIEDVLHPFAQFQACLQAAYNLSLLLMHPFGKTLSPDKFFSGSFVYNCCRDPLNVNQEGTLFDWLKDLLEAVDSVKSTPCVSKMRRRLSSDDLKREDATYV